MKKIIDIFSLRYIFLIFVVTLLANNWYVKIYESTIKSGVLKKEEIIMLVLSLSLWIISGILLCKIVNKFIGYIVKRGGLQKVTEINTSIVNAPIELDAKKILPQRKYEKDMMILMVSSIIFVVALLYPAWTNVNVANEPDIVYGYLILQMGWVGIIALYAPWYFIFPAIIIIRKIATGVAGKMLLSRVFLFLFWLEGFIAVVVFKWAGAGDDGDWQITSIGPSFWMWTILVWYILISSYIYVNFSENKIKGYTKGVSVIAATATILVIAQYHFANLM